MNNFLKPNESSHNNRKKKLINSSIFAQRKYLLISFIKGILRLPDRLNKILLTLRDIEYQLSLLNSKENEPFNSLLSAESSRNSQNGEDGVIDYILESFGRCEIQYEKNFLEIGVGNGDENNTTQLLLRNFRGVWVDANSINCEFIKKKYKNFDNLLCINSLIDENNLDDLEFKVKKFIEEKHLTFLSVDIDSIDGLVSSHLAEAFKPLIIVVEINSAYAKSFYDFSKDPSYANYEYSVGTTGYGASLDRFKELFSEKYVYIYTERTGTNSFFVRKDKYNLVKHLLGEPINRFSSSQRFHLGNYEPKSGHKFTPPTKKQL